MMRVNTSLSHKTINLIILPSLYFTLQTDASLVDWLPAGSANLSSIYLSCAGSLQSVILTHCFDEKHGLFKDNATDTTLYPYPQDANSMVVLFDVVSEFISENLIDKWTPIGAETLEITRKHISIHFKLRDPSPSRSEPSR